MTILLLIAAAILCVSGFYALGIQGIPNKEFRFGENMIVTGAVLLGSGFIMVGLALVVAELRRMTQLLELRGLRQANKPALGGPPPGGFPAAPGSQETQDAQDPNADQPQETTPWPPEVAAIVAEEEQKRAQAAQPPTAAPGRVPEPRLTFDAAWPSPAGTPSAPPATAAGEAPAGGDSDAQPASTAPRRSDVFRRSARASSFSERPRPDDKTNNLARPDVGERSAPPPPVAVSILKSGSVDGMAYTLYSDGSIEAELAEGPVRFASIDALRAHLDDRG